MVFFCGGFYKIKKRRIFDVDVGWVIGWLIVRKVIVRRLIFDGLKL